VPLISLLQQLMLLLLLLLPPMYISPACSVTTAMQPCLLRVLLLLLLRVCCWSCSCDLHVLLCSLQHKHASLTGSVDTNTLPAFSRGEGNAMQKHSLAACVAACSLHTPTNTLICELRAAPSTACLQALCHTATINWQGPSD
jgi:hypothetical protein